MKRVLASIVSILSILIILFCVFVLLTVVMTGGNRVPSFMGVSIFRVASGSMTPTLPVGTLILVKETPADRIQEGDVITFYSSDPSLNRMIVTHRVVAVDNSSAPIRFVTRGDANLVDDEYSTTGKDIIGVMFFSSLFIGSIVKIVSSPLVFFLFLVIPLFLFLILNVLKTVRMASTLAEQIDGSEVDSATLTEEGASDLSEEDSRHVSSDSQVDVIDPLNVNHDSNEDSLNE